MKTKTENISSQKIIAWVIARSFYFSLMAVIFSLISPEIGPFQIICGASLVRFFLLIPIVSAMQESINTKYYKSYLMRAIFTIVGFSCFILALRSIPINNVVAITYASPVLTSLLATMFVARNCSFSKAVKLLIGVIGILIIMLPHLNNFAVSYGLGLCAALMWSIGDLTVKMQVHQEEKIGTQLVWSTIFMLLISLPLAVIEFFMSHKYTVSNGDLFALCASGLLMLLTNLALYMSTTSNNALWAIPFTILKLFITAFITFILFGEKLDMSIIAGVVLIILSHFLLARNVGESSNLSKDSKGEKVNV